VKTGFEYKGPPVDIFACGVILFLMLTATPPFEHAEDIWHLRMLANPKQQIKKRGITIDASAMDLFLQMVCLDSKQRITIEGIKAHPWMNGETSSKADVQQLYKDLNLKKRRDAGEDIEEK
jgi:serine/threonine protein kinase